jgi:hypothetical protein
VGTVEVGLFLVGLVFRNGQWSRPSSFVGYRLPMNRLILISSWFQGATPTYRQQTGVPTLMGTSAWANQKISGLRSNSPNEMASAAQPQGNGKRVHILAVHAAPSFNVKRANRRLKAFLN